MITSMIFAILRFSLNFYPWGNIEVLLSLPLTGIIGVYPTWLLLCKECVLLLLPLVLPPFPRAILSITLSISFSESCGIVAENLLLPWLLLLKCEAQICDRNILDAGWSKARIYTKCVQNKTVYY